MKRFWYRFIEFAEMIGTARAAAELSRNGHYQAAQNLMLNYNNKEKE